MDEIERLENLEGAEINNAKIALADAATAMLHGDAAANEARESAAKVFQEGASGDALPTTDVAKADIEAGMLVAAGFTAAGLTKSNGEARRHFKAGAAKCFNGQAAAQMLEIGVQQMEIRPGNSTGAMAAYAPGQLND